MPTRSMSMAVSSLLPTGAQQESSRDRRVAAVDVGTNTALLVIADYRDGRLIPVFEDRRFVRLGEGVDQSGVVSGRAIERLSRALRDFRNAAQLHGATHGVVGATSASRDAANRDALSESAEAACGWPYEILTGETEARLTFAGAMAGSQVRPSRSQDPDVGDSDVRSEQAAAGESSIPTESSILMIDVGGGSTELVRGRTGPPATVDRAVSADAGSVRITERFFGSVPPTRDAIREAETFTRSAMTGFHDLVDPASRVVGAGGTVTTLAGLARAGDRTMRMDEVRSWRDRLLGLTAAEVLALDEGLLRGREDIFAGGVLVLTAALETISATELVASPWGLRHGLALRFYGSA